MMAPSMASSSAFHTNDRIVFTAVYVCHFSTGVLTTPTLVPHCIDCWPLLTLTGLLFMLYSNLFLTIPESCVCGVGFSWSRMLAVHCMRGPEWKKFLPFWVTCAVRCGSVGLWGFHSRKCGTLIIHTPTVLAVIPVACCWSCMMLIWICLYWDQ